MRAVVAHFIILQFVWTTVTMLNLLPLLFLLGATPVLGSSSPTVLQNLIRGSALKCAADLGGGLRTLQRDVAPCLSLLCFC
jgi:hypothetical protein